MKNNNTLVLILGLALVGVIGYFILQKNETDSKMMENEEVTMMKDEAETKMEDDIDAMVKEDETMVKDDESAMMEGSGKYVVYGGEDLMTKDDGKRVLFFYANWCPTCQPVDAALIKADLPADLTVIKVNYNDTDTDNTEKALANKYGVIYQHTFVQIDANGEVIKKWNGGSVEELLKNIK
ncbi:MAG: peroxiredoxin family protein [Patescibacteria group bacterium]